MMAWTSLFVSLLFVAAFPSSAQEQAQAPSSPAAKQALARYSKELKDADEVFREARIRATKNYLEALKQAMHLAMRNQNVQEIEAIDTEIKKTEAKLSEMTTPPHASENEGAVEFLSDYHGKVDGAEFAHCVFLHPRTNGDARKSIEVGRADLRFQSGVALDDNVGSQIETALLFQLVGDGSVLWQSEPVERPRIVQYCSVSVVGIKKLELVVKCPGSDRSAHALWVEPHFVRGKDVPATAP